MKRAIVIGASSGIGHEVARLLIMQGWTVGVAARRKEKLEDLKICAPERVFTAQIDVTDEKADEALYRLIEQMGGLNLYFHSAGIGWKNPTLDPEKEMKTMQTNGLGFVRMVGEAIVISPHTAADTLSASLPWQAQKAWEPFLPTVPRRLCRTPTCKPWNSWQPTTVMTFVSRIFVPVS